MARKLGRGIHSALLYIQLKEGNNYISTRCVTNVRIKN